MSEIQKYSREWFATHSNQNQKEALNNLKKSYESKDLNYGTFEDDFFLGPKEQIEARYKDLDPETMRGFLQSRLIDRAGGLDNVFNILDENGDGEISKDELDDAAAVVQDYYKNDVDTTLTARDLKAIYENAMGAEDATIETDGNKTKYSYKDGDVTEFEYADDGHLVSETYDKGVDNGRIKTETNYDTLTSVYTVSDSQGRVLSEDINAPGMVNDKQTIITYDDQKGTRVEKTTTIGKVTTTNFNENDEVENTTVEVKYNSDGVIDPTKQHSVGECWLLSGVNALASTEKGRQIISDAIQHNDDGSVTVTLKGVERSYTYSAEEIVTRQYTNSKQKLATGDVDMKLLEMAVTDYKLEILPDEKKWYEKFPLLRNSQATPDDPLNGGNVDEMMEYLTGEKPRMAVVGFSGFQVAKKERDPERYAMTAAFLFNDKGFGSGKEIISEHVYSVSRVTKDTVYLVNPWDSSQEIAYPKSRFYFHVGVTSVLDLNKVD